jgi:hypothetical protein
VSFSGRRQFFGQPPRITVLLQTMNDIIGNAVAFFFSQLLAKSSHKFARAHKRECDGERRWRFLARSYGLTERQSTKVETQPFSKGSSPQP